MQASRPRDVGLSTSFTSTGAVKSIVLTAHKRMSACTCISALLTVCCDETCSGASECHMEGVCRLTGEHQILPYLRDMQNFTCWLKRLRHLIASEVVHQKLAT